VIRRRRFAPIAGRTRKRATDWLSAFGSDNLNPGFTEQDWIIPPFGNTTAFPDFIPWSHATLVSTIVTIGLFINNSGVGLANLNAYLGVIRSQTDVSGNPTNTYLPDDNSNAEWVIRIPMLGVIPSFGSLEVTSLNMDRIFIHSKAQRKLSDDFGLVWVLQNESDFQVSFNLDIRALVKKE